MDDDIVFFGSGSLHSIREDDGPLRSVRHRARPRRQPFGFQVPTPKPRPAADLRDAYVQYRRMWAEGPGNNPLPKAGSGPAKYETTGF